MIAKTAKISKLSNGLTVITDRMETTRTAAIGLWINVGTRHEPEMASGVAHLVEHMLFKGTKQRTAFDITAEIEDVGGQMNAYTSREQTAYYVKVLPEDLPRAFDVLADILQNSLLDPEELSREREVIIQEIGQTYDQPDELLQDELHSATYDEQIFGRPILGTAEIIGEMERQTLADYIARYYTANNITLVATGDIDEENVLKLATQKLSSLPAGAPPEQTLPVFSEALVELDKETEQANFIFSWPGVSHTDADAAAFNILAQALGGGMSSRLFQEVREKRGLVYNIYAQSACFLDCGNFTIGAGATPENCREVMEIIARELKSFDRTVTQEELDRARAQLRASFIMSNEGVLARAEHLGHNYQIYSRVVGIEEIIAQLDAVSLADLKRVAHTLRTSPMATGIIGQMELDELKNLPDISEQIAA